MGGMLSAIGIGSNTSNGANFQAQEANLTNPVTGQQVTGGINQAQGGINQQQAFLNALQAQNGIGNQSSVYNQLQGVANGTGPNPAQAQLAQATGQNVANQAALMAGQRGASQNVGLIARQAAQQGASTQQQAANQAAVLQANQSLNALGQLGGLANQQVAQQQGALSGLTGLQQSQQTSLMNQLQNQNQNQINNLSQANAANAGIANTNAQTQGGLASGLIGGLSGGLIKPGATGGKVKKDQIGSNPLLVSQENSFPPQQLPMYDEGTPPGGVQVNTGVIPNNTSNNANLANNQSGPTSFIGKYLNNVQQNMAQNQAATPKIDTSTARGKGQAAGQSLGQGINSLASQGVNGLKSLFSSAAPAVDAAGGTGAATGTAMAPLLAATGGKVPALLSPGERYLKPNEAQAVAKGKADPRKTGEKIPGQAKVKGDSLKNDTVKKNLDVGGIVVPRSVATTGDSKKIAAFVAAHLRKLK